MAKKIMMVDDSKTTRSMVTFTLRRAGYEVMEAEDGSQALELIGSQRFDCVITDINMPVMDGLELIRRLRANPAHQATPILMLTTTSETAKKQAGQDAGASGWLGKPFHPNDLIKLVAAMT